jgi:hypothetical protein
MAYFGLSGSTKESSRPPRLKISEVEGPVHLFPIYRYYLDKQ